MADIVLKDRNGRDVQYPGVNYLKVNTVDGGTQGFAAYDPETLTAENLPVGVTVGDVEGSLEVPELLENVPVALDFSSGGNMEFAAPDGYAVKSAVIQKPADLEPEYIVKGKTIAGIEGAFEAGGGGSDCRIDYTKDESGNIIGATPYGFRELPEYAFAGIKTLTWVDFSNCPNLTSISARAFYQCSALTSITIPEGVTSIDTYAFYYCSALTSITIPDTVTSIGANAFESCQALTSITIPATVTSIGKNAFYYCSALTSITIPDTVTRINAYTFAYCKALTSITIPATVTSIGKYAFNQCTALANVTFEDTSTWYRSTTDGATSGGTQTEVTNTATAATYLRSTYASNYWYKV